MNHRKKSKGWQFSQVTASQKRLFSWQPVWAGWVWAIEADSSQKGRWIYIPFVELMGEHCQGVLSIDLAANLTCHFSGYRRGEISTEYLRGFHYMLFMGSECRPIQHSYNKHAINRLAPLWGKSGPLCGFEKSSMPLFCSCRQHCVKAFFPVYNLSQHVSLWLHLSCSVLFSKMYVS